MAGTRSCCCILRRQLPPLGHRGGDGQALQLRKKAYGFMEVGGVGKTVANDGNDGDFTLFSVQNLLNEHRPFVIPNAVKTVSR